MDILLEGVHGLQGLLGIFGYIIGRCARTTRITRHFWMYCWKVCTEIRPHRLCHLEQQLALQSLSSWCSTGRGFSTVSRVLIAQNQMKEQEHQSRTKVKGKGIRPSGLIPTWRMKGNGNGRKGKLLEGAAWLLEKKQPASPVEINPQDTFYNNALVRVEQSGGRDAGDWHSPWGKRFERMKTRASSTPRPSGEDFTVVEFANDMHGETDPAVLTSTTLALSTSTPTPVLSTDTTPREAEQEEAAQEEDAVTAILFLRSPPCDE